MKRIFYTIVVAVTLLIGITFVFQNRQLIDLHYYFGIRWTGPLSLA